MELKVIDQFTPELLAQVETLEKEIFAKNYREGHFSRELPNKEGTIAVFIFDNNKPIAYKVGYKLKVGTFYSWVGGVAPAFRGQGLAKKLMEKQHSIAKEKGYKVIRTHTMNRFRKMLLFNIKSGFQITGTYQKLGAKELSIILEKNI